MPLTGQTVDVQIRPQNQEAPATSAPVGRVRRLVNKIATRFEGQGQGAVLKVEPRPGLSLIARAARDVETGQPDGSLYPGVDLLATLNDELVAAPRDCFPYVYSEATETWSRYRFVYNPSKVREYPVVAGNIQIAGPDAAFAGGVIFRTWSEPVGVGGPGKLMAAIQDVDGAWIRTPFKLADGEYDGGTSSSRLRVVAGKANGDSNSYFYVVASIGTTAVAWVFDLTGKQLVTQSFQTLATPAHPWDLTSVGGVVLYAQGDPSTTAVVTRLTYNTADSTISPETTHLGYGIVGDYGVQWAETTNPSAAVLLTAIVDDSAIDIHAARIGNLTGAIGDMAVTGYFGSDPLLYTEPTTGETGRLAELTGIFDAGLLSAQVSFTHENAGTQGAKDARMVFLQARIGVDATVAPAVRGVHAASRPFTLRDRTFIVAYFPQNKMSQTITGTLDLPPDVNTNNPIPTYFLLDCETQQVCGEFDLGTAGMEWARFGYPWSGVDEFKLGPWYQFLGHVFEDGEGRLHVPLGWDSTQYVGTRFLNDIFGKQQFFEYAVGYHDLTIGNRGRSFQGAGRLLMPGPLATSFDGQKFTEQGITLPPAMPRLAFTVDADKIEGGTHTWLVVFESIDGNGDRIVSAPSSPASATFDAASSHSVTLTGDMLRMTSRTDLTVGIYRNTVTNGVPGSIYYRVNDPLTEIIRNDPSSATWTYTDTKPDADIEAGDVLYTSEGQLPADPCPAFSVGCFSDGRAFVVGPDNSIYYSGIKTEGQGLWFSLAQRIPKFTDEEIVSIEVLDGTLIVFTDRSVWAQSTQGLLDATGAGSNVPNAVRLPFTNGGTGASVVTPAGVVYASSAGGLWLVSRSLTNQKLSGPVDDDLKTAGPITSIAVDAAQRIYAAAAPIVVVFDQLSQTWSVYSPPTAPDLLSTLKGVLLYADAIRLRFLDASAHVDQGDGSSAYGAVPYGTGAYGTGDAGNTVIVGTVEFEPLHFTGIKKFTRLWGFNAQGTTLGPHAVTLSVVYDRDTQDAPLSETWTWDVDADDAWSFEFQPMMEQCENITLTITDQASGNAASYTLEALGAYVAVENGLARVKVAKRIQSSR